MTGWNFTIVAAPVKIHRAVFYSVTVYPSFRLAENCSPVEHVHTLLQLIQYGGQKATFFLRYECALRTKICPVYRRYLQLFFWVSQRPEMFFVSCVCLLGPCTRNFMDSRQKLFIWESIQGPDPRLTNFQCVYCKSSKKVKICTLLLLFMSCLPTIYLLMLGDSNTKSNICYFS